VGKTAAEMNIDREVSGRIEPLDQIREILHTYDDESLLRDFLTPKVCERSRLYAFEHSSTIRRGSGSHRARAMRSAKH
jgi:spore cortex formation protein SpoVR/YcgB (stage V sporulation)